jgi:hypothetical protein
MLLMDSKQYRSIQVADIYTRYEKWNDFQIVVANREALAIARTRLKSMQLL